MGGSLAPWFVALLGSNGDERAEKALKMNTRGAAGEPPTGRVGHGASRTSLLGPALQCPRPQAARPASAPFCLGPNRGEGWALGAGPALGVRNHLSGPCLF